MGAPHGRKLGVAILLQSVYGEDPVGVSQAEETSENERVNPATI